MSISPLRSAVLVLALLAVPLATEAKSVVARQHSLNHRRNEGFRTGKLNHGEDLRLQAARSRLAGNVNQLQTLKANADADGYRNAAERAGIQAMRKAIRRQENHISHLTYNLKHNGTTGHPHSVARTQDINQQYKPNPVAPILIPTSVTSEIAGTDEAAAAN